MHGDSRLGKFRRHERVLENAACAHTNKRKWHPLPPPRPWRLTSRCTVDNCAWRLFLSRPSLPPSPMDRNLPTNSARASDFISSIARSRNHRRRPRYVLGHEAMRRMAVSNILLVGLKGLGVEIGALRFVICVKRSPESHSFTALSTFIHRSPPSRVCALCDFARIKRSRKPSPNSPFSLSLPRRRPAHRSVSAAAAAAPHPTPAARQPRT